MAQIPRRRVSTREPGARAVDLALGIMPYITVSIIQLLGVVIPQVDDSHKEGREAHAVHPLPGRSAWCPAGHDHGLLARSGQALQS